MRVMLIEHVFFNPTAIKSNAHSTKYKFHIHVQLLTIENIYKNVLTQIQFGLLVLASSGVLKFSVIETGFPVQLKKCNHTFNWQLRFIHSIASSTLTLKKEGTRSFKSSAVWTTLAGCYILKTTVKMYFRHSNLNLKHKISKRIHKRNIYLF